MKETKEICTSAACHLKVQVLGINRTRFSRQVKNEHNSKREDEYTQPVTLWSEVTWPSAGFCTPVKSGTVATPGVARNTTAEQLCQEPATLSALATEAGHIPGPGHQSRPADGSLEPGEWPWGTGVAYSGSVAVAGSYGDRVKVMCPHHIIGVD